MICSFIELHSSSPHSLLLGGRARPAPGAPSPSSPTDRCPPHGASQRPSQTDKQRRHPPTDPPTDTDRPTDPPTDPPTDSPTYSLSSYWGRAAAPPRRPSPKCSKSLLLWAAAAAAAAHREGLAVGRKGSFMYLRRVSLPTRPHHRTSTASHPNCEVKPQRARLVRSWGTRLEARVLSYHFTFQFSFQKLLE